MKISEAVELCTIESDRVPAPRGKVGVEVGLIGNDIGWATVSAGVGRGGRGGTAMHNTRAIGLSDLPETCRAIQSPQLAKLVSSTSHGMKRITCNSVPPPT